MATSAARVPAVHRWFLRLSQAGVFEPLAYALTMADREPVGPSDEPVLHVTARVDDGLIGVVATTHELVVAQVLSDVFDGIEFWLIRRLHRERDVVGNDEIVALVPTSAVRDENGMSLQRHGPGDLDQGAFRASVSARGITRPAPTPPFRQTAPNR